MSRLRIAVVSLAVMVLGAAGMAQTVSAADDGAVPVGSCAGGKRFLTFPAWYNGIVEPDCSIKKIENGAGHENDLRNLVFRIILNIVEIILQLVAYATIVFLIKGGFNYMTSTGDPGKIGNAKKTIQNALIGLVISLAAVAIINLAGATIK